MVFDIYMQKPDGTTETYEGTNPETDAELQYWNKQRELQSIDDSDKNNLKKKEIASYLQKGKSDPFNTFGHGIKSYFGLL